jgi:hypothetical protein
MLVERSSSDETSAAADGAVIKSADGCDEPRDPDAIGVVDPDPVSDDTGSLSPLATLDVIPAPLASIASEAPGLPLTSLPAGMSAAELEVVPGSEPCPLGSPAPPPVAVS